MTDVEVLEWCGRDIGRLHEAYFEQITRDPDLQHPALVTQLQHRLGWPLPDTDPDIVATYAGRPAWPLARVLAVEESRPAHYQRADLIAELQLRVAAAGDNASSVAPISSQGLFR